MNQNPPASPPRAIVHTENSLGWGGQEMRVFNEARAMRARGHRVWLATPVRAELYRRAQAAGMPVLALDDRKSAFPATICKLVNLFRRERVDVVNTHSSRDGWLGGIAARLAGVPLIIRSRHIEVDYPNRFTSRIAFRSLPHQVLTTSGKISERLIAELGLNPGRVTCVPTGINLAEFRSDVAGQLHQELGLRADLPLVGMISVLRSWKGHGHFLEAAAEILQKRDDVRFVIAGDGPGRELLRSQIAQSGHAEKILMLGHREDVPNLLASLTVLALPSTAHEGVPQIILQAQAMGKAVVASKVGGIPEVVQHEQTGLLTEPGNSRDLAEKIIRLLEQPQLCASLGGAAREQVRREHSLERMCGRLEEIYRRHLGS